MEGQRSSLLTPFFEGVQVAVTSPAVTQKLLTAAFSVLSNGVAVSDVQADILYLIKEPKTS